MKNCCFFKELSFILSIVAFTCSIVAISLYKIDFEIMHLDSFGVLSGIMTFLVSVLMAWNLSQLLENKKIIDNTKEYYNSSKSLSFCLKGDAHLNSNNEDGAIEMYLTALKYGNEGKDREPRKIACNGLLIICKKKKIGSIKRKKEILRAIKDIDEDEADDLRELLKETPKGDK